MGSRAGLGYGRACTGPVLGLTGLGASFFRGGGGAGNELAGSEKEPSRFKYFHILALLDMGGLEMLTGRS